MEKLVKICGLGAQPPEETTLETLAALEECAVVFTNIAPGPVFEWLKGYCRKLERARAPGSIVGAAMRKSPVGLAVWGHPRISSALARRVHSHCRSRGVGCRFFGAISPAGSAFARSTSFIASNFGFQAIQSYELSTLLDSPRSFSGKLPLVVYSEGASPRLWRRLGNLLASRLPSDHALRLFPLGGGERAATPENIKEDLGGGAVLLVPPRGKATR